MKNILLAITGASPQVVTETLYALHTEGKTFPDEMYIITTVGSKKMLCEGFFDNGHLAALKKEYNMPDLKFDESHIWLIEDDQGNAIEDAKSIEDQTFMADFITRKVFELTNDPSIAIHASIAGGRKTMAFYLGYAMSLLGRPQDTLSHVFVNDEFEFVFDFYYPTKQSNIIAGKRGGPKVDTKDAVVTLAEIPFVRMRESVEEKLINSMGELSFSQTVSTLNASHSKNLTVNLNRKTKSLSVTGVDVKFTAKEFAFYNWLLNQQTDSQSGILVDKDERKFDQDKQLSASFLTEFNQVGGDSRVFETSFGITPEDFKEGKFKTLKAMDKSFIQPICSTINKKLNAKLNNDLVNKIEIKSDALAQLQHYYVQVKNENIEVTLT